MGWSPLPESRGVDPIQGHLYLLLRERAPDNGVVAVLTDDVIQVLQSVKSNSFLERMPLPKDLLVYNNILDSVST